MNKYIRKIGMALGCCLMVSSCAEVSFWDNFLGDQPESSGVTTEEMFSSRVNAEQVLTYAYTGLISGLPTSGDNKLGVNVLEAITDLCYSRRDNISDGPMTLYYNGALSATNLPTHSAYLFGSETDWRTIRYAWLYLENVDQVPDMTATEKDQRKAEAKVLLALSYYDMMKYIGGVPWLDHAVDVNENMEFPRVTFSQTVENIVALLDDVINNSSLPWRQTDATNYGRMSKAAAMALKFKVLLFAASPTFNSNTPWRSDADEYTCYGNYDASRWQRAVDAGNAFFTQLDQNGEYSLVQPTDDSHRARRLAFRQAYFNRGSSEVLISVHKGWDNESVHTDFYSQRYYTGPTLNYVNMFAWDDGTEFQEDPDDPNGFDWANPSRQPFFEEGEDEDEDGLPDLTPTRDPRLYETAAVPGDDYYGGTAAPVYTNAAGYHLCPGFLIMKYVLQQSDDRSSTGEQWSHTRLAEIMLGYAEALNEVNNGPTTEAYQMVNDVRNRVGMPDLPENLSKDAFLEAVLKERAMELGFEEVRWFDIVRRGRSDLITKPLYGLTSVGNDRNNPTSFTFEPFEIGARYWESNWDTKWYLAPIPQNEINKDYGMTQNPGW